MLAVHSINYPATVVICLVLTYGLTSILLSNAPAKSGRTTNHSWVGAIARAVVVNCFLFMCDDILTTGLTADNIVGTARVLKWAQLERCGQRWRRVDSLGPSAAIDDARTISGTWLVTSHGRYASNIGVDAYTRSSETHLHPREL